MSGNSRIPPIQCLLTFEALARLRSVTQAAEELCVTPSAVSHRVKQLEQIIGTKLFGRADFSLTTEGNEYLAHVREGLVSLQRFPSASNTPGRRKLRLAVTPTFARSVLMPRLKHFLDAYPEIDITLQVSIPLLDVVAEDADLTVRFGTGRYSDVEHVCLAKDEVTPLASPAWLRENGPFASAEDLQGVAVAWKDGRAILLEQVANVRFAAAMKRGDAGYSGVPAVIVSVQKQPAAYHDRVPV